jgi:transposase
MGWRSGQTYSEDLRARVLSAVDGGGRVYEIAGLFEVSVSYIYKALARRRLRGLATALPKCGRPGRKLDHHLDALVAHVAAHPDATLAELVEWSSAQRGVKVCIATMWATLEALGMTLKKRPAMPPSKNAKMLRLRGSPGVRAKPTSASIGLSLSMRPGRQPT